MATGLTNPSVFLYNPGVAKIEESPYPEIKDAHDVVLRIAYVGVCGSDVYALLNVPSCLTNSHTRTGPFLAPRWNHRQSLPRTSPDNGIVIFLCSPVLEIPSHDLLLLLFGQNMILI
jgi:hypothetical protein